MCLPKSIVVRILSLMFMVQVCYVSIQLIILISRQPLELKQPEQQLFDVSFAEHRGFSKTEIKDASKHSEKRSCSNCSSNGATIQSLSSFFTTNYTSEKFTIIVPTYKRNYCIYSSLRHYCKMKYVAMIIVLWNNLGEEIPRYLRKIRCHAGAIKYIKMTENRMTTRYILFPEIQTEAILALDDDRIVSEESLMLAYRTWKNFRHKIIGFCSRTYGFDSDGNFIYEQEKRFPYSLILPNAAFIHRKYLVMFTNSLPRNLYEFIDEHMNVDDIAMNAMIADFLTKRMNDPQCSGFLVNETMSACRVTGSEFTGLWRRNNHYQVRTDFLRLLNQTYGYMPLTECDIAINYKANIHTKNYSNYS